MVFLVEMVKIEVGYVFRLENWKRARSGRVLFILLRSLDYPVANRKISVSGSITIIFAF